MTMDTINLEQPTGEEFLDYMTCEATRDLNDNRLAFVGGGSGIVVVQ